MYNGNVLDHLSRTYANGQFTMAGDNNDGFGDIDNVYKYNSSNNQFINNLVSNSTNTLAMKQQQNFNNFTSQMLNNSNNDKEPIGVSKVNVNNLYSLSDAPNQEAINMVQQYVDTGKINTSAPAQQINNYSNMNSRTKSFESFAPFPNLNTHYEYKNRQLTSLILTFVMIGFVFYMLVQLYMSQKKIEYMLSFYNQTPEKAFPFNVRKHFEDDSNYY